MTFPLGKGVYEQHYFSVRHAISNISISKECGDLAMGIFDDYIWYCVWYNLYRIFLHL